MKGKVLILASVASMIDQFNMSNINTLIALEYEVHVACNFEKGSTCTKERINELKVKLDRLEVTYYQIDFTRSVFNVFKDINAYKQVKNIMIKNNYKFVHCHSPIGGVIGRLACHVLNTKCIYTAHGFHFFKGAPLKNWIFYYPIEKWLSKYTDVLITINKEDYARAKKKFMMKELEYIPGVGINIGRIDSIQQGRENILKEFQISQDATLLISVGELSKRKNHEVIIRALPSLPKNTHYLICGQGVLQEYLLDLANKLNVIKQVHLLGFRSNVIEIVKSCDIFVFPSLQEGLPVALMEAMACGLPCIVSKIRGNTDLILDSKGGFFFEARSATQCAKKIDEMCRNKSKKKMGDFNEKSIKKFSDECINEKMSEIYIVKERDDV